VPKSFRPPAPRPLLSLPLLAAGLLLSACASRSFPSDDQRSLSFQPFQNLRINAPRPEPFDDFLRLRTALLITGSLPVRAQPGTGRVITLHFAQTPKGSLDGPSHAVPISHDGYFLTSGHLTSAGLSGLIYWDGLSAQLARPRIVAQHVDPSSGIDIALLHIDARVPLIFDWATDPALQPGSPLASVGCSKPSSLREDVFYFRDTCIAGPFRALTPVPASPGSPSPGSIVWSDLPFRPGDSGGPLVSPDGRLLAINSRLQNDPSHAPATASFRPDPAWIDRLIQQDRAHPSPPPPAPLYRAGQDPVRFVISF
jgi:hypothetical protein